MSIQDNEELEAMREAGRIVEECLREMQARVRPGVTTTELNRIGAEVLRRNGARSAPMLVYGFPAETCISVNDEIVHGIPSERTLHDGDMVTLDVTAEKNGFMADAAVTVVAGEAGDEARALIECVERAFREAMSVARAGNRVHEIGRIVEREVMRDGFRIVRELCGHGIGRNIHEAPIVPNYHDPVASQELTPGLVITVEPIIVAGSSRPVKAKDGWTVITEDGACAAHHEHTIVITTGDPMILTAAA